VPLKEIPRYVIKALLATEDARFYDHFGVDVVGTLRAALANAKANGVRQGGSTLTQQLAKNLFLSPERSFRRKIHEAFLALWIEARLSKDEILKMYLDRSYMGAGNYGVEAASQFYFGKSVRDVNIKEAAILAGLFKAPSKYAPHLHYEAAMARANVVLYRMLDADFISYGELMEARRQPVGIVVNTEKYTPNHFLDWVYRETIDTLKKQGLTQDYAVEVKTTIDTGLQKKAQKLITDTLNGEAKAFRAGQAALVAITPDGAVKTIIGGKDYETSQFNRATDASRQPGSSFKPFVYLTALLKGYTPRTIVLDAPITVHGWSPKNYSHRYHGKITLTQAISHSYNSVPVRLMTKVGRKAIVETARKAGLKAKLRLVPSLPLGSNEVTVFDLASAYCSFANGGKRVEPYTVLEIRRPDGTLIYSHERNGTKPVRVFPEEKIAELVYMMGQVVTAGTARRAQLGFTPVAGKTGTTSNYHDAWFAGFTGHLVTVVWFGNDDSKPTRRMTGGSLPAKTWKRFMLMALHGKQPKPLPGIPLNGSYAKQAAKMWASQTPAGAGDLMPSVTGINDSDILIATRTKHRGKSASAKRGKRRARANDPIVGTLRNMFSIFRTGDRQRKFARRTYRRRNYSSAARKRRARRNVKKVRNFWSIFR